MSDPRSWSHWMVIRRRQGIDSRGKPVFTLEALAAQPRASGTPAYVWRPYLAGQLPDGVALSSTVQEAGELMADHGGTHLIPINMIEAKLS